MIDENDVILQAKIKAQIIKQIFKDLGPKNLKGVENFYVICCIDNINLQFLSEAKDILITIILKKNLFHHYLYAKELSTLTKYQLSDFTGIGYIFENNKQVLDMEVRKQGIVLSINSTNGKTCFVGEALNCDQDDEEFTIQEQQLRPASEDSMQLKFSRVGIFESILSYARTCKLNSLWLRYDSVSQKLQIADRQQREQIKWLVKVEEVQRHAFNSQLQFHCKTLNCAINLLPNDSELIMTFYSNFILLDVPEKEKTFTIRLNAKQQIAE